MTDPCTQQPVIQVIRDDVKEMKSDIKTLIQYHHQLEGEKKVKKNIFRAIGTLVTLVIGLIGAVISRR